MAAENYAESCTAREAVITSIGIHRYQEKKRSQRKRSWCGLTLAWGTSPSSNAYKSSEKQHTKREENELPRHYQTINEHQQTTQVKFPLGTLQIDECSSGNTSEGVRSGTPPVYQAVSEDLC
jgi:hypothetical protein